MCLFFPLLFLLPLTPTTYVQIYEPLERGHATYYDGYILEIDVPQNRCTFYDLWGKLVLDLPITGQREEFSVEQAPMRFENYQENKLMLFFETDNPAQTPVIYQELPVLETAEIERLVQSKRSDIIEFRGRYYWETTEHKFYEPIIRVTDTYFEVKMRYPDKIFF